MWIISENLNNNKKKLEESCSVNLNYCGFSLSDNCGMWLLSHFGWYLAIFFSIKGGRGRLLDRGHLSAQTHQSSLSAWRSIGSLATYQAHSQDSDLHWTHMPFHWFCDAATHMIRYNLSVDVFQVQAGSRVSGQKMRWISFKSISLTIVRYRKTRKYSKIAVIILKF